MAPLHTEPVLTANEQLTGKYSGKHPGECLVQIFVRSFIVLKPFLHNDFVSFFKLGICAEDS